MLEEQLLVTGHAVSYPLVFFFFLLGLTLESPPPLPHSPMLMEIATICFSICPKPLPFSFNTARFTGFL